MEKRARMILQTGSNPGSWKLEARSWNRSRPPASHCGLTLVEILVSVAILAGAIVLIMQALLRGSHALAVADRRFTAYAFCASRLADLEFTAKDGVPVNARGRFRMGREPFEWQAESTPVPDDPALDVVTLRVAWRDGRHDSMEQVSLLRRIAGQE